MKMYMHAVCLKPLTFLKVPCIKILGNGTLKNDYRNTFLFSEFNTVSLLLYSEVYGVGT